MELLKGELVIRETTLNVDAATNYKMDTKPNIKIIKRSERNQRAKAGKSSQTIPKKPQDAARDMVNTVSEWVSEFQRKRRAETSEALKSFLLETSPQSSKA